MDISVGNAHTSYQLFYQLAFIFMFFVVIYKSIKQGYHLRSVLLMLTTITLFSVVGSRLFTIPIENWIPATRTKLPEFNNRSSIGGLLFGLIGLLISQRLFRFKRPILDLFAWTGPISLGIMKLGCLFNGCCFGLPFNGFCSVQYPVTTNAHYNHWFNGSIENDATLSLSVHPVQLYESLILIIIGCIVWKTHKKWRKNGSATLFALFAYFTVRFGVEFFRDHSVSQFGTTYYLGIWIYQWMMLGFGIFLAVVLWLNEKRLKFEVIKGSQNSPYLHAEFVYIVILSFFIYNLTNLLLPFELKVVWFMFIPAIILSFYHLFTENRLKSHPILVALWLIAPFYVLAQTIPNQTPVIKKYKRIDFGGSFGNFANEVAFDPQQSECGSTVYFREYFKQVYQIVGAGYSMVSIKNNKTSTFGVNVSGGNIKSTNLSTNETDSEFVFAVNPYAQWDSKWFGAGAGFQFGKLRVNKNETIDATNIEEANKTYNILPEFHLRVGPEKYVDIDYNYGFMMPSAYPTLYSRSSIGSAFGFSRDYSLRYGRIWNLETDYISAEALVTENLGINLMYVFKENNFQFEQDQASGKFVFSLNYRFGHKTKQ
ncbi:prolipoprotein diacylglyceryl transferase [uncultured Algibacter sp.]|uniref:prolipoprotein diacylglyceryl transferase n=1 Tax=uncultured Algibacter sp. TaxID=298659 RepID=UPI00261BAC24|nr:prolipoprotein diacylglyceryl transferase family protein [uncultured Algibacter sp.]